MKTASLTILGSMVFLGLSGTALPKAEYTKAEKKACTACHVKTGSKELNDTGKCYQKNNHSLKGCEEQKPAEKKS